MKAGGAFGVGSDSNVLIGAADELRLLEYSRRLHNRARNVLAFDGHSTGRTLYDGAVAGGARSMGAESGIAVGHQADFVALKPRHDAGFSGDKCLDSWIFANGMNVDCVWVSGVKQVEGGRHNKREEIAARFSKTMKTLMDRL
jgi:prepilin-type processing-associated H-X9-DG protein